MIKNNSLIICILLFFFVLKGEAECPKDTIKVKYKLNPVVITATKIKGVQRDLTASISVVDHEKIEQASSSSVLEIIKTYVPSLYITEWGIMGFGAGGVSAGKISLRGVGGGASTHVLILRNGRPDFMGLMGCTIADEFGINGVERVEVIRGPGSFLYGTNATGGVINIISANLKRKGFKTKISTGFGPFNSQKFYASHMGKEAKFEYNISTSFKKTDGHRSDADNFFSSKNISLHTSYRINPLTNLEFNSNFADININDPGTLSESHTDHWYDLIRYGGDLSIVHKSIFGETNLKIHANFGHHKFYDGWKSFDRTTGIMAHHNFHPLRNNTTTIGFDLKKYGGKGENTVTNMDFGLFYNTEYGPYIFTKQILLERFILSAGLRIESCDIFKNEIVPKIGINSHISSTTSFRLSIAKGFRSPSLKELYFFPPQNAELKPELIWNYEAGLIQYFGNSLKCEAVIFTSEGNSLIRRSNPGFPFQWINSGSFIHTGIELLIHWFPSKIINIDFSWSQIDPNNETLYTPGKKFSGNIFIKKYGFTLNSNLLCIMDLYGADYKKKPMDDYTILNISIESPGFYNFSLKTQMKNILNTEYQSMFGYPMPGRHIFMNLNYSF